ncbi:MAG: hypothetical protein R6U31_05405 [bacterium]
MKKIFAISGIFVYVFLIAQWTGPFRIGGYASSFFPPVMLNSFVSDNNGNSYLVWHDNSADFYFNISMKEYDGSAWQPGQRIDDPLNGQGDYGLSWMPSISVSPDGKYLIAWEDYRTGNFEIHSKYYNGLDIPSQIQVTSDSSYCWYPKLLYGAGAHHLFYISNKTGYFNIYHSIFDSSWQTAKRITDMNFNILDFHYTVNADSSIDLVFTVQNGNYANLYGVSYDGSVWGNAVPLIEEDYNIYNPVILTGDTMSIIIFKSEEEGISRIMGMKNNGLTPGNPVPLSDNYSNAMYPSGFTADSTVYLYYVSDESPTGIFKERQFKVSDMSMISDTDLLKEKGGEIYYPQSTINSSGDIVIAFMCADTIHSTTPNTVYYMKYSNAKKSKTTQKPYVYNERSGKLIFDNDDMYNIRIISKTGRIIMEQSGITEIFELKKYGINRDIYFMIISDNKNRFTEKILWLD